MVLYFVFFYINPLNPKYFYIVHCACLSSFPVFPSLYFYAFLTPTIHVVGVRPQLTECGRYYYSRGQTQDS